ncbi:MAG: glycosyltransferase family 2 protein [Candidatus Saccharibacteria bacterium]|nr:MAG: glycosyltransferase family 2 protein [Candidatus Saccharibacteria bacterium]
MTKQLPEVAIITRTKDRAILLERAIQSVHKQTMGDFIHVIINDAGDPEPVDRLVAKYEKIIKGRVKVIHNDRSSGMEAASNKAIQSVDSVFVAIHDDDDTWHPEFLERSVESMKKNDSMGVVVRTDKVTEELVGASGPVNHVKTEQWMPDMKVINLYRQCIDNQMTPITFIYRRSVFKEIGYYDETLPVLGDWDFGIRFLQKYDVEFLDPGFALANYHHRKFVAGSTANNSFGSGTDRHRYYSNKLMNKYLRQEIAEGRLGVGYIMSKLKYDQGYIATVAKRLLPNFIVGKLKNRVRS